ncbi:MAG: hypothetical protein ACLFR0_04010 [Alphaproteobacteria bacterium]
MAFLRSEESNFRLLYLGGGSVHGISQAEVLVFMEELAGIPIAWQYDMISGDSVGSAPAAVLNCPKEKGSYQPRYTARQYRDILKDILQQTFEPFRDNYYPSMLALEIAIQGTQKAIDFLREWTQKKDKALNKTLSSIYNAAKDPAHTMGIRKANDPRSKQKDLSLFNLHSGFVEKCIIPFLERRLEKAKEQVKDFFFSADVVHQAFDKYLAYDDGEPVLLEDVITGFHSEAFNIDNTRPEAHSVMKPIENWEGVITHKGLPLAEIPKRSMPAQTVFKPYYSEISDCSYDDIAQHNTMAAPMNAARRKIQRAQDNGLIKGRVKRKGMSIGTGMEPPKIDAQRMGELLILGRLDSAEGAPLLKIPLIFNTSKAIRDLTEELGEENAIFIDKIMDKKMVLNKYKYRDEIVKNPAFSPAHIRQNLELQAEDMPRYNLIDARSETLDKLELFGVNMVWDHLEILVQEVCEGLKHAHKKGFIDQAFLNERLKAINEFYPHLESEISQRTVKSFTDYLRFGGRLPQLGIFAGGDIANANNNASMDDGPQ